MGYTQVSRLLHSRSSVVEEKQKGMITQGKGASWRKGCKECIYLIVLQVESLSWRCALNRNCSHMLSLSQHRGIAHGEIVKEGADRCQAVIAGAYLIVPFLFKEAEKVSDPLASQIR
jgi:hypothetical protein